MPGIADGRAIVAAEFGGTICGARQGPDDGAAKPPTGGNSAFGVMLGTGATYVAGKIFWGAGTAAN
jgi:hypothetical protein